MKKLVLLLGLVCCYSCVDDNFVDDNCDGVAIPSFTAPNIAIELIDAEGNNLIENGTLDASTITIASDIFDGTISPLFSDTIFRVEYLNDTRIISYEINLSESRTDILILDVSERNTLSDNGCFILPDPILNSASYNDVMQNIIDNTITVVIETE